MNRIALLLCAVMLPGSAFAQEKKATAPPPPPLKIPTDAECSALAAPIKPLSFGPGELLEYELDAMGATAGKLLLKVLPVKDGMLPVEALAQTNTFFSKVRRVKGTGTSYLNPKTLRPMRYTEESVENEIPRSADVTFKKNKTANLKYTVATSSGSDTLRYANDALDVTGAVFLLRQIPLKKEGAICFDAYGIRKMWRVFGKIEGKEHISSKVGEFEAWHIAGHAVRVDNPAMRREIHMWISDDSKRLPLLAIGAIDLGAIRATLVSYARPGDQKKAEGKETLKW